MTERNEEKQTALVLVDVQNSFFTPTGGNYFSASRTVVPILKQLLQWARKNDTTVIHIAERHRPKVQDFEYTRLPEHCIDGSFDAGFVAGFGPAGDNEFLLPKRRVSAFFATDLDLLLREKNIGRLVVAGVKTNVCVRATVVDGFSLGYNCLVPHEGVASNRNNLSDAALEDIKRYFGWVVSLQEAKAALL